MNAIKLLAIVLVAVGVIGLGYGGFTYTRGIHEASLGPIGVSVADRERVNIPVWAGVGSLVVGGALLLSSGRKA